MDSGRARPGACAVGQTRNAQPQRQGWQVMANTSDGRGQPPRTLFSLGSQDEAQADAPATSEPAAARAEGAPAEGAAIADAPAPEPAVAEAGSTGAIDAGQPDPGSAGVGDGDSDLLDEMASEPLLFACGACGEILAEGAAFCGECGTPVATEFYEEPAPGEEATEPEAPAAGWAGAAPGGGVARPAACNAAAGRDPGAAGQPDPGRPG